MTEPRRGNCAQMMVDGEATTRAFYLVHGISIWIAGPADITRLIHQRLARFHSSEASENHLVFTFRRGDIPRVALSGPGRKIYELDSGCVTYDSTTGIVYARYHNIVEMTCNSVMGRVDYLLAPDPAADRAASNILFTLPLIELMRRRDIFNVHAAGLCRSGNAVLLAGGSGAGKSTLTLALTQAGWDYLADDMLFLRASDGNLLGFPEGISYTRDTLRLVPWLPVPPEGSRKGQLWPETVFHSKEVLTAKACALVFPGILQADESVLTPMTPADAFLELASNVLMTDQILCETHFHILAKLTQRVPSFRLATGWQLRKAIELIHDLLPSRT